MFDNSFNDQKTTTTSDVSINLNDFWLLLKINLKAIIVITIIVFLISVYTSFSSIPEYNASTTLMLKEKASASLVMDFGGSRQRNQIINEIQLIQSRTVAEKVVDYLWKNGKKNYLYVFGTRQFTPRGQRPRNLFKEIITLGLFDSGKNKPVVSGQYNQEQLNNFSRRIQNALNAVNLRNTDIIKLTFTSPFPEEAQLIVNTVASVYLELDKKWSNEQTGNLIDFLENQVAVQSDKLEISEKKLKVFKEKEQIYDLDGNAPLALERLVEFETKYFNIIAEINISNQQIKYIRSKLNEDEKSLSSQLLNDVNIQVNTLRISIGELESQLVKNKTQYGSGHAAVISNVNKIESLKEQLSIKTKSLISQGVSVANPLEYRQEMISQVLELDAQMIGKKASAKEYKKLVDNYNKRLLALPAKQLKFARLNRDYSVLSENYTFMLSKLEEGKIKLASEVGKVNVVDSALRPTKPSKPIHSSNLLLGLMLGLGLGIGLTFTRAFLDNTVKSADDIQKHDLSVLGIIPAIGNNSSKSFFSFLKPNKVVSASESSKLTRHLITREDPKSPVSEAYRSLRTSMIYASADKKVKSILVSSSGPGEGKTTTVANLAITFANLGKKTLLIDTDLRRPVVHKVFNCSRDNGITSYLSGVENDFNKIIQKTNIDNLSVVTSGIIPPNPSELLGSKRMTELVRQLEEKWDMVLFDSPPLVAVTDATMVSKEIDQIVMVVKAGHTDKKAFQHTVSSLKRVGAPLGGVILNAVTNKNSYGSYYYYYQYYHYYGSEKGNDNKDLN
jgi:capsular exopolysaccharide synthesis family protein